MQRPPSPTSKTEKPKDDIGSILFPAEVVDVPIGGGVTLRAEIYPFSFEHMQRFSGELVRIASIMERMKFPEGTDPTKIQEAVVAAVMPHAVAGLMPVIAECVMFLDEAKDLSILHPRFPAAHAGVIVKKWIEMNFADLEKWSPWMEAKKAAMEIYARAVPPTSPTPSHSSPPADST